MTKLNKFTIIGAQVAPFLMIKKLIDKLFSEKITVEKIECAIDDETVDCKTFDDDQEKAFVGVPAPTENVIDEWFADRSGEVIIKDQEVFAGNYEGPFYAPYTAVDEFKKQSYGDDGMHQKMYDMSTQNGKTTLQLNPIGGSENFQGGSENVHR